MTQRGWLCEVSTISGKQTNSAEAFSSSRCKEMTRRNLSHLLIGFLEVRLSERSL